MIQQGQRLTLIDGEDDFLFRISETPSAYGTVNGKDWFCTTPNGLFVFGTDPETLTNERYFDARTC